MQTRRTKTEGGNKVTAFLKRNIYYILMILCVLAIGSMITVAAVLNNDGGQTDVVAPPDGNGGGTDKPSVKEFILTMPVTGDIITVNDQHIVVGNNQNKTHQGIDIKAQTGANVVAPFDGTVIKIDKTDNVAHWGAVVVIDHGNGYISTLKLLDNVAVELNQKVTAGQTIAKVIGTEKTTFEHKFGDHIHYELTKSNANVDPTQFMADGNK